MHDACQIETLAPIWNFYLQNYVFGLDFTIIANQNRRALHRIAQLANIARPAMLGKNLQRRAALVGEARRKQRHPKQPNRRDRLEESAV